MVWCDSWYEESWAPRVPLRGPRPGFSGLRFAPVVRFAADFPCESLARESGHRRCPKLGARRLLLLSFGAQQPARESPIHQRSWGPKIDLGAQLG